MMRLSRFWKTLDALVDAATDRREWLHLLGQEFDQVEPLLRSSGTLATSIACPTPGGEGCPRRVVRHDDGSIRAICGDRPKACDDLDLSREDVTLLELDRVALARRIFRALGLSGVPERFDRRFVFRIGSYDVFAGRGFPVFLTVPGAMPTESSAPFDELVALPGPKLLLSPTAASIPAAISAALDRAGVVRIALHDVLVVDDRGLLRTSQPTEVLFANLRAQVEAGAGKGVPDLAWQLPPDARWDEIGIRFTAAEVVNVTFRGETRRFEPDHLGLKNAKDGKPKAGWTYLRTFALAGGRLPVHHAKASDTSKHQKQKQSLSKALRNAFGISDEPIPTEGGDYVTRFVVNADDLQQGRQGQSRRSFVGSS